MIPLEAVEAAAGVIALGEMEKTHYLKVARLALEAAAPHMLADPAKCAIMPQCLTGLTK